MSVHPIRYYRPKNAGPGAENYGSRESLAVDTATADAATRAVHRHLTPDAATEVLTMLGLTERGQS